MSLRLLARQLPQSTTLTRPVAGGALAAASSAGRTSLGRTRPLNTATAAVLYTARATVLGSGGGRAVADNFTLELAPPSDTDGVSGRTNPEELFAAGYGACFQAAMMIAATAEGVRLPSVEADNAIETHVHLVGDMQAADMGLRVEMRVKVRGVTQADLERVVARTKAICPYTRATEGNMETRVEAMAY